MPSLPDRDGPQQTDFKTDRCTAGNIARSPSVDILLAELEQKNTELAEAVRRADAASHAKSAILANISHELRTPLNIIIGFAELMQNGVHGSLGSDQYSEYVDNIYNGGLRLLDVVNDILDLSKASSGQMALSEDTVDVCEAVSGVCRIVRPQAEIAKIAMTMQVCCKPPQLWADERRLKQMLSNLLSNALKFTPKGGEVMVVVHSGERGAACISVHDNGIGIAIGQMERVLEPFAQADGSLDRKHNGAGLGLPLTKAIIELHGGKLLIESAEGKGTVATLTFPPERSVEMASAVTAAS
jgi:signal transduction histidine kinase